MRQVAAANLGQLVRMSPRVDQLATDLSNNARAADASIKVGGLVLRNFMPASKVEVSPHCRPDSSSGMAMGLGRMTSDSALCRIIETMFWLSTLVGVYLIAYC